jgi:uncharacterized protein (DUF952 family)
MIYHITPRPDWDAAQPAGVYTPPSLPTEGFIHCSYAHQVERVANAFYAGADDLVLLCIREGALAAPLRVEPVPDSDQRFPHIYGPLNLGAVSAVVPLPKANDGTYTLPEELPRD